MQGIENAIITPIKDMLTGSELGADLVLAIIGVAAVIVAFLCSLLFRQFSSANSFSKKLQQTTAYLQSSEEISEENVEGLNNHIKSMPESVQKGWGCFLEQKMGYPSDYISTNDVLLDKKFSGKNKAGKTFFRIFSAAVIILTVWLEYMISKGASLTTVGLADFTSNFELVGAIIAAFCAPLLIYIILNAVLGTLYNKQYQKLEKCFSDFQNELDSKVIIYAEEEDEFVSENIGEINEAIESIISDKMEEKEIVEIVTAPKVEEKEIVEIKEEEVPQKVEEPEIKEEEPKLSAREKAQLEEIERLKEESKKATPAQKQKRLEGLVNIIDTAVNHDKDVTKKEIEELAVIINNEIEYGYRDENDKGILKECLKMLADKYNKFK